MAQVTNRFGFAGMSADAMKKAYRKLALEWHPDVSAHADATDVCKVLNAEFAYYYASAARDEVYTSKVDEKPASQTYYYNRYYSADYIDSLSSAIEWLLNNSIYTRHDLTVELCGVFIWISGDALRTDKEARLAISDQGFSYQAQKKAWYYTPGGKLRVRTNTSMDYVRNRYGSQKIYGHRGLESGV